ncbi:MAG TPA: cobalamin-independent methionine synthase II family protein [Candidatus Dormibacteraeota bacterium]|nr:cobalamin-independent methionine synthase II family protein [Candidatus Dormibacteraeota bacterium]
MDTTQYRAEHVGSLLRPPELLAARQAYERGDLTLEQLRDREDEAAAQAIALQREVGIEVFTDGEVRRGTWMAGLLETLDGVVPVEAPTGSGWRRDHAPDPSEEETHWQLVVASERVRRRVRLTSIEADYLARHAPGRFKITMMSASMGGLLWNPDLSRAAYPSRADLVRHLVELQAEEIGELVDQGVTWIQLDSLSYMQVIDPEFAAENRATMGISLGDSLDELVALDNQLVRAAKAKNPRVTVAMHFCRGNNRSAWRARGGYEPIAERLFGGAEVDRFLLEYDTERAGGFEPLRFVPRGKVVVLGLISSKVPRLESQDELCRRIDEAARYVPLEQLAISPQCGFASTAPGNLLTADEQRRKLELVVDTARRVWG